jgi:hypothetical protein
MLAELAVPECIVVNSLHLPLVLRSFGITHETLNHVACSTGIRISLWNLLTNDLLLLFKFKILEGLVDVES